MRATFFVAALATFSAVSATVLKRQDGGEGGEGGEGEGPVSVPGLPSTLATDSEGAVPTTIIEGSGEEGPGSVTATGSGSVSAGASGATGIPTGAPGVSTTGVGSATTPATTPAGSTKPTTGLSNTTSRSGTGTGSAPNASASGSGSGSGNGAIKAFDISLAGIVGAGVAALFI